MNKRIKELLEQASEYAHENRAGDWEVGPAYQDIFHKKFAQLIIEEMHDFIIDESANDNGIPYLSKVKQHFGVEE